VRGARWDNWTDDDDARDGPRDRESGSRPCSGCTERLTPGSFTKRRELTDSDATVTAAATGSVTVAATGSVIASATGSVTVAATGSVIASATGSVTVAATERR